MKQIIEVQRNTHLETLGTEDFPQTVGRRILESLGFRIPSFRELAILDMNGGIKVPVWHHYGDYEPEKFYCNIIDSLNPHWNTEIFTKEGIIYTPEGKEFLVKDYDIARSTSSKKVIDDLLNDSIELPIHPFKIKSENFGEEQITLFCFGDLSKEYGNFLRENRNVKYFQIHTGPRDPKTKLNYYNNEQNFYLQRACLNYGGQRFGEIDLSSSERFVNSITVGIRNSPEQSDDVESNLKKMIKKENLLTDTLISKIIKKFQPAIETATKSTDIDYIRRFGVDIYEIFNPERVSSCSLDFTEEEKDRIKEWDITLDLHNLFSVKIRNLFGGEVDRHYARYYTENMNRFVGEVYKNLGLKFYRRETEYNLGSTWNYDIPFD